MNKKRLVINMAASVVNFLVSFGISFFLSPYLIEHLGSEAYGFFSLGNQFVSYASILSAALNSMASRFVTIEIHRGNVEKRDKLFSSVIISNILISLVLLVPCVLLVLFLEKLFVIPPEIVFDVKLLWSFLFINFLLTITSNAYGIATFAANKLYLTSMVSLESSVIRAVLLVALFWLFKPSLYYLGVATLLVTVYTVLFNIHYTRRLFPDMRCKRKNFDISCVKELLSSGVWNSFTQLASVLNNGLDLLIANLFISSAAMGTLSITKVFPTYIAQIISLFGATFTPELAKNYAQNDKKSLLENIEFARCVMTVIISIPIVILMVNGDAFFGLWIHGSNSRELQIVSISGLFMYLFVSSLNTVGDVILLVNKQKYVAITYFIAGLLNIGVVFLLLKYIDRNAITVLGLDVETVKILVVSGVSGLIAVIRNLVFTPIYAAKCLNEKYSIFYKVLFKGIIGSVLTVFVTYGIKTLWPIGSWIDFFGNAIVSALLGLVINVLILFDRKKLLKLLSKIKQIKTGKAV